MMNFIVFSILGTFIGFLLLVVADHYIETRIKIIITLAIVLSVVAIVFKFGISTLGMLGAIIGFIVAVVCIAMCMASRW